MKNLILLIISFLCCCRMLQAEYWHMFSDDYRQSLQMIDFDSDGDIDALSSSEINGIVFWYENDGYQHFTTHEITLEVNYLTYMLAGDVENDGDVDIVYVDHEYGAYYLTIAENTGYGNFSESRIWFSGDNIRSIQIGRFNDDDDPEILFVCDDRGVLMASREEGEWDIQTIHVEQSSDLHGIDLLDSDHDGDLEIYLDFGEHRLVFIDDQNNGYDAQYIDTDINSIGIAIADVFGDEELELISIASTLRVYSLSEEGYYDMLMNILIYDHLYKVDSGDYNGDGEEDIFVQTQYRDIVFLNTGADDFIRIDLTDEYYRNNEMIIGDFDGDNDLDLLGACEIMDVYREDYIFWLENSTGDSLTIVSVPDQLPVHHYGAGFNLEWVVNVCNNTQSTWSGNLYYGIKRIGDFNFFILDSLNSGSIPPLVIDSFRVTIGIPDTCSAGHYEAWCWNSTDQEATVDSNAFPFVIGPLEPASFALLQPSNADYIGDTLVTMTWEASQDSDLGETPHYDVWIGHAPDLSDAELVADSIEACCFSRSLETNSEIWYWTVRATDSTLDGTWAIDTLCFIADNPSRPWRFNLIGPENNYIVNSEVPEPVEFCWWPAEDSDLLDTVRYSLIYATEGGVGMIWELDADTVCSFTLESIPRNRTIWWTVVAEDRFGLQRTASDTFHIISMDTPEQDGRILPEEFSISGTWPNPFNATLAVEIALPEASDLNVTVFNVLGEKVEALYTDQLAAGYHRFSWYATDYASGIYFIQAAFTGKGSVVKKVYLVK